MKEIPRTKVISPVLVSNVSDRLAAEAEQTQQNFGTPAQTVDSPVVASTLRFGTKAETLEKLAKFVRTATILEQIRFTVSEWREQSHTMLLKRFTEKKWLEIPLIVRSSAYAEDLCSGSLAGHFLSVPDVFR